MRHEFRKIKKRHALDTYVIFSITMLLIYTIVNQYLTYKTGYANDTLTTCFFGFFGGEVVTCALIKIFKLKEENNERTDL